MLIINDRRRCLYYLLLPLANSHFRLTNCARMRPCYLEAICLWHSSDLKCVLIHLESSLNSCKTDLPDLCIVPCGANCSLGVYQHVRFYMSTYGALQLTFVFVRIGKAFFQLQAASKGFTTKPCCRDARDICTCRVLRLFVAFFTITVLQTPQYGLKANDVCKTPITISFIFFQYSQTAGADNYEAR